MEDYRRQSILKAVVFLSVIIFFLSVPVVYVHGEEPDMDNMIQQQIDAAELDDIGRNMDRYGGEALKEIIDGYDPKSLLKDAARGSFKLNYKNALKRFLMLFLDEIYVNMALLIKLVVIAVVCAVLKNMQSNFLSKSVGEVAFFVSYIVLISVVVISFSEISSMARGIIGDMVDFMYSTSPVLVTLMASSGGLASGAVMKPLLILAVEFLATLASNVFVPLIIFSVVLAILNSISERVQLSKLAEMLSKGCTFLLGFILTVFIFLMTVQGTVGAIADGITGKSLKFIVKTIPVIGGYLSDAADTVLGCTLMVKNAAGLAVMIGLIGICLFPLLKIGAVILLFKAATVLVEPISDERITECMNDVSKSMGMIFAVVVLVAFMFIITVSTIIGAGNISAMIR